MNWSKNASFADRLSAAAEAKKAQLERAARARSAAESPAAVERRMARDAVKVARDARIDERRAGRLNRKTYMTVTATLFLVVAIMHLLRIIFGWQVEIGGLSIPFWVSWLGVLVAGALAIPRLHAVQIVAHLSRRTARPRSCFGR